MKTNSKPWFDNEILSPVQRWYKKFKHSDLKTDKCSFKIPEMLLQKMILKKKKSHFEEKLAKNRSKPKELWRTLKSLGLSSDKARKSKIYLKKDVTTQFEALENAKTFERFYSELSRCFQENLPKAPNKFTSQTTKNCYAKMQ